MRLSPSKCTSLRFSPSQKWAARCLAGKPLNARQIGVSLVELLIAMTLGLLLLAGMLAVFSSNKESSELNTAMANIQENARFALNRMTTDIRMAGFQGCLDTQRGRMNVKAVNAPIPLDGIDAVGQPIRNSSISAAGGAVVLSNGSWQPPIPGGLTPPTVNPAIPGTHVLSIQYGFSNSSPLDPDFTSSVSGSLSRPIRTVKNLGFKQGDLALVGNCEAVDMFEVTDAPFFKLGQELSHSAGADTNLTGNLSIDYYQERNIANARVMRFSARVYYVGDTGLENDQGDAIRALYLQTYPFNDPANPPVEIVQGVENMRISYGQRDGNTLRYLTANDTAYSPENIESVQLGLIMSSWDHISETDDENTYFVAGQTIEALENSKDGFNHAEDARFRLVFNTTVKIRNRRDERIDFQ